MIEKFRLYISRSRLHSIFGGLALLCVLGGCSRGDDPKSATAAKPPATTTAPSATQASPATTTSTTQVDQTAATAVARAAIEAEKYERIPTSVLSFYFVDKSQRVRQDSDGNILEWVGTWESLSVEGIGDIALTTNNITVEDGCGVLDTKDFGKIRVSVSGGQPTVWLKPSQKEMLLKLKKTASK
jgi:hypothetical protein